MAERTVSPNSFYVYALFRADGTPFYIGKGRGNRWLSHEQAREIMRNTPKSNTIRLTISALGEVPKVKLVERLTEPEAFTLEKLLIATLGRRPIGPLVNLSDGGDGPAGYTQSPEAREKMSIAGRGRAKSPEHRAKIGAAQRGRKRSGVVRKKPYSEAEIEAIRRVGLSNRGKTLSEATRQKMSATRKGRKWTSVQRTGHERRYGRDKQLKLPFL